MILRKLVWLNLIVNVIFIEFLYKMKKGYEEDDDDASHSCETFYIWLSGTSGSDHLYYLQNNNLQFSWMTRDLKKITLVRCGTALCGYIQFRKEKRNTYIYDWVWNVLNIKKGIELNPIIDFNSWYQKFLFDHSNKIFYEFLYE